MYTGVRKFVGWSEPVLVSSLEESKLKKTSVCYACIHECCYMHGICNDGCEYYSHT